ncbi:Flp pilus assembly protein TadG [Sphingomonas sp. F9_3S_D5_B_2]
MFSLTRLINQGRLGNLLQMVRQAMAGAPRLRSDTAGNVLVIFGVAMPLMFAGLGLAVEGANWYQTKRALQNAADEAVVAAATNNADNYQNEARAVAAKYGFTNGVGNVTVTAAKNVTCPTGAATCYSVTITRKVPLLFTPIAGFAGNTNISGRAAELISARAVASFQTSPRSYCMLALASSAPNSSAVEFTTNGAPKADLHGCNVMSNASMKCNGSDLNAGFGDAVGTSIGCGKSQTPNSPPVTDPYASLASNIPGNSCTSYSHEPSKKNDPALPAANQITGTLALGTKTYCGDVQLTGNVTLTGTNVIVIRNGKLDTNGFSITTATNAAATIIFSGTNDGSTIGPAGGGSINISSPTSGTWSGVALYTDPTLTTGVTLSAAGNTPSWNISGLAYFPHSSVTFSGAVGKSTSGKTCFVIVVDNITINGTGSIINQSECAQQGLTMPSNPIAVRGRLVA